MRCSVHFHWNTFFRKNGNECIWTYYSIDLDPGFRGITAYGINAVGKSGCYQRYSHLNDQGDTWGLRHVLDITERKQAEKALDRYRDELETKLKNGPGNLAKVRRSIVCW
jgi:hypothetical protein